MTGDPALSIVVPTCGRRESIRRLLSALTAQVGTHLFETIVVADGISAAEAGVGDTQSWPFSVTTIGQDRRGAAAARNLGASHARSDVLLFLDDDVEPGPEVVASHVELHTGRAWVIGAGGLTPVPIETGFVGSALAGWWEVMCDALTDPRHRFTFRDLLTGHSSMSRATFERVGGFDLSLLCHEDFDFGYRAIEAGMDIVYVTRARACHHDASDLDRILKRKVDEGVADVQLARKHPALVPALPLGRPLAPGRLPQLTQEAALSPRPAARAWPAGLRVGMRAFEALSARDKWRDALERLMDYHYWRGILRGAGSREAVHALAARRIQKEGALLDIDLSQGIVEAERRIDAVRPAGLRISVGLERVGELPGVPGAEPLRGIHLRPLLLKTMAEEFAAASARAGLVPEVFLPVVAARASRQEPPAPSQSGRAA